MVTHGVWVPRDVQLVNAQAIPECCAEQCPDRGSRTCQLRKRGLSGFTSIPPESCWKRAAPSHIPMQTSQILVLEADAELPRLGVLPVVGGHHTPDQTYQYALLAICTAHFPPPTTELESHSHHLFTPANLSSYP